ncbi:MAG: hypothetical protein ACTS5Y_10190, partial [Pollutimonas bauzanensis]
MASAGSDTKEAGGAAEAVCCPAGKNADSAGQIARAAFRRFLDGWRGTTIAAFQQEKQRPCSAIIRR